MIGKLKNQDVAFEFKHDGALELTAGNVATTFASVESPTLPDKTPEDRILTMPTALFAESMRQALTYASTDDSRPTLCGVHYNGQNGTTHVTATDGHRLFTRSFDSVSGLRGPGCQQTA